MSVSNQFLSAQTRDGSIYSSGWRKTARSLQIPEPASRKLLSRVGVAPAADIRRAAAAARSAQPVPIVVNRDNHRYREIDWLTCTVTARRSQPV